MPDGGRQSSDRESGDGDEGGRDGRHGEHGQTAGHRPDHRRVAHVAGREASHARPWDTARHGSRAARSAGGIAEG
jgi:hypothetical protein